MHYLKLKGFLPFQSSLSRVDFPAEEKGLELYSQILMTKYVSEFHIGF